nr:D-ribose transporter ATP-binding protein [Georgenia sp. SUBG003]
MPVAHAAPEPATAGAPAGTAAVPAAPAGSLLLEVRSVSKSFPGVKALENVSLDLRRGEILGVCGENGAGKSTLMKILAGIYDPDPGGEVLLDGRPSTISNPHEALAAGLAIIHQEFELVPDQTVAQNIYMGREPRRLLGQLIDDRQQERDARALLRRLKIDIDPARRVRDLTVAQQQMVEIAKALSFDARILIMDEPTAALTDTEIETLFRLIRDFVTPETGIIYISHRMPEIKEITDRVTVIRDGQYVGTVTTADVEIPQIISMMVGRSIATDVRPPQREVGEPVLEVEGLSTRHLLQDVSFTLRRGEILGFAGLMGAGRTEMARAVVGADPTTAGTIKVGGREVTIRNPADAVAHGVGYLSEDRKRYGLLLDQSVRANIGLSSLRRFSNSVGFVRERGITEEARTQVRALRIKTPSVHQLARNLSGGNQQKTIIGKWLTRDCDVLIVDEPTRGIDVGAKDEIYNLLNELVRQGKSIIVISSELPEVLRLSDRIAVMCEGRITGFLDREEATQERIMELATLFSTESMGADS